MIRYWLFRLAIDYLACIFYGMIEMNNTNSKFEFVIKFKIASELEFLETILMNVCLSVSTAVIKHQDCTQLREERAYCSSQVTLHF